jgi:opacity protein-like surface antigen
MLLMLTGGSAWARPDVPWDGNYFGVNLGSASVKSCNSFGFSASNGAAPLLSDAYCDKSSFLGGVQIGDNFEQNHMILGIAVDLDYWSSQKVNQAQSTKGSLPAGTYDYSSKETPSFLALVTPRFGYDFGEFMPYVRAGLALAPGVHDSAFYYTPEGSIPATAKFNGGKDLSTAGWAAGGGFELGFKGPWSLSAEYLHASLGKGSNSASGCSGTAANCAPFAGATFTTSHQGFTANLVRIGVTYYFSYW